jgi:hypothetical protein
LPSFLRDDIGSEASTSRDRPKDDHEVGGDDLWEYGEVLKDGRDGAKRENASGGLRVTVGESYDSSDDRLMISTRQGKMNKLSETGRLCVSQPRRDNVPHC